MWQQWFVGSEFRYATGDRLTVLKFDASVRSDMTDTQRRSEILAWLERSRQPRFDAWLAAEAAAAIRRAAVDLRLALDLQADQFARERDLQADQFAREREALAAREADIRAAEQEANDQAAEARAELRAVQASRTWRIRNRLVRLPPFSWLSRS